MIDGFLRELDWNGVASSVTRQGFASMGKLLSPGECGDLTALYGQPELFRSRIDMAKYRFGRGEYQYFRYELPQVVQRLRQSLYPGLAGIANTWEQLFQSGDRFPAGLDEFLDECHTNGQLRPTPLLLRYRQDDFNCLHQDVYGDITFPFQVVFFLSQPDQDYSGGEFLLAEQAPRSQTMVRALRPQQGEAIAITTRHRPANGSRGVYRIGVRHGVSTVTAGKRYTLGIIFHDAK